MSAQVLAKKTMVLISFALFSLIFVGAIFAFETASVVEGKEHASYLSWLIIAYVAGLSMIVLPCTLPLVFIIVPMSIGQGYKKGLSTDISVKMICDYCDGPIGVKPHVFKFAKIERFFCCTSCKSLYKEKYKGRIEAIIRKS